MSTRPKWFRFVLGLFVFTLINTSLLVSHARSQALVFPVEATLKTAEDKTEEELMEEFFPYSSKTLPAGLDADNLITASTYPFSVQTSVALEDMSSGTTDLVGPALDDTASPVTNIGFEFWFDGTRHTQFSINANGLARLGSTVIGTTFNNSTSGLNTVTNAPKIAAYFEDLCTGPNGKVHYKVVGSAPNRKLVVEWRDMKIPRESNCTAFTTFGTFQMWLFESAAMATPGRIQFVYGAGVGPSDDTDLGASIGLQSGVATNFASVTVSDDSVSYATANNTNLEGVAAGKSYIFTPNVPVAPSGLTFSPVTQLSIQLNWTDNATNEFGYAIYRSTDGVNYNFLTQAAADAVNFNDTDLLPGTTYHYRVHAVTEGAISSGISGSQATNAATNDSCAGAGGLWSSTATWTDATVPAGGDNVTIGAGCTVTVDVASAAALSLNVAGTLQFVDTTASTLAVTLDTTIAAGGTVQSAATGTVTTHLLSLGGNLVNNGTLDLSTNGDTAGAELRFTGAANNSWTGTGINDLRILTVNKGSGAVTPASPMIDVNVSNMTVRGLGTGGVGFLNTTLFNGIVKFSGSNTFSNPVFQTAGYTIPSTGGVWFDNSAFTVVGQNGSPTTTGMLRLTNGTLNVGTSSGNSMGGGTGGQFIIEGGTANIAGRLQTTSSISYTQSGGTVNVCTVGNTATTACFGLTSTANTFNMTGGSIVLNLPNTNAAPLDYSVSTSANFIASPAGTTLQLGSGATPPATTFRVLGATPSILINSGHSLAVGSGTAGGVIFFRGSTLTNNGAIVVQGTGTSSRFDWAANGPMTYSGSGTFGTAVTPFAGVGMSANGGNTAINSPIVINRINLFTGGFTNSGQITLGNGGTSTTVVQVGNSTTPTNAGTFDVSPVYNSGSGGHIVLHLRTTTLNRVTGFEINPTRTLATWTVDDNAAGGTLTVAGGNISVPGTFNLTNGTVVTGANTITNDGTVVRVAAFVDGNLSRNYTAAGAYTYHVGDGGGYSPVAANVTAGTGSLTASAVATAQPNIPNPAKALSRHWKLSGSGITSDLTFSYLDPADIPATATEANFVIQKYDGTFTQPGGTVDTAANTASITGVTSFSDWTLAEPGAFTSPGVLALSSGAYSTSENNGSIVLTVNRTSGTDGAVTVDYSLSGGTATGGASCGAGIDYVNTGGTVSFANGESSKNFSVTLCGDADIEPDESFNATLSNPTGGAVLGSPATATVTILNDDGAGNPVTVTASAGTPSAGYATLTAAIAAINDGTHQGNIAISISQNTTEPASVVLNSSGAGAANYTAIVIRPSVDAVTVAGPSVQGRGLIELNGADNVTIDGDNPNTGGTNRNLTIQNTAANTVTFTSVIRVALAATVVNTADNNIFRNLNIVGSATGRNIGTATTTTGSENTTFGIFSGPGASTTVATNPPAAVTSVLTGVGTGATATNLTVNNNNIVTAARGVSINGSANTVYPGLLIEGNSIGNPVAGEADQVTAIGITAQGSTSAVIRGNTVYVEGYVASSAAGHGINVGVNSANTTGALIERNRVNRVENNNPTTWSAFGINLGGGSDHVVRNNFVSGIINDQVAGTGGFGSTFGAYGIRIASGTGHDILHNSVHLYGALQGTVSTDLTAAFLMTAVGQTGVDVRNNIFSNQITGGNPAGTRHVAIALPSGTVTMNLTLNNNGYYAGNDPLSRLAQVGFVFGTGEYQAADFDPTATTPAANFRAYTSTLSAAGTNDNASFATTAPPPFTSNTDLHIPAGSATRLESGGAAVGVTDDIDLEPRNATTPDIGADEFAGNPAPANDVGAVGFVVPANGSTIQVGPLTPEARFSNFGTATQTNVTVRFRIVNSSMVEIYNQTAVIPSIAPLQNLVVSFPMTTIAMPGTYTMHASSELAGDQVPANDSITGSFTTVTPIGGTINVGTGETFTSLTNPGGVFQALNTAGISGNLVVNITSDLTAETGVVALNQLVESGAGGYTVTFKPSGAARTISGTPAAGIGMINLHGADRIIFDGSLSGGTDRSLTISSGQTGTSTVFWIRSASAANGANNNTIKNCIIHGTSVGATAQTTAGILAGSGTTLGGPAEAPNNNNTINNNWIYRVQNSFYNQGNTGLDQNWAITDNEMGSSVEADKNRFRGMLIGNANNFVVSGNNVHGVTNFTNTTGANTGIHIAFAVTNGMVVNNRISDIHNLSASGTGAFGMQLGATPTTNIVIANNFIWDVQAAGSATVTSNGHGITINGAATAGGYKIYHNAINMNTNQASGTTAALNITSAVVAAGALDVRNNIFANTQTAGATRRSVHSAAAASVFAMIDYNDYFSTGSVGFIGGLDRPTLADWQTGTGMDVNSKAVDPLFVSPTDLHIQAGSPMINMGVAGTGVTTDIDGQTRDAMPDIGADEIVGGSNPGTLQFSAANYVIGESGGTATITVTRTGGSDGTVTVNYATVAGGTATGGASCTAGIDYVTTSGILTFVAGDVSETFTVTICPDSTVEPNETINMALTNPTGGAVLGAQSTAVLTINDDDGPMGGTLSINDVRTFEGNSGATNLVFTVSYNGPTVPVSVDFNTKNGTAVAGVDYLMSTGTLTFNTPLSPEGIPAPQTRTITVVINGDVNKEANETFFVNLSNATGGATLADAQGVGIIIDEDRAYVADFDRDRVSDFSVFRPSTGTWYVLQSASATPEIVNFGLSTDIAVPGDYDADGQTDFAVFRPSTGEWFRILSTNSSVQTSVWGTSGDKPVQGDYDGDGKTDLAIYRPSTGTWWILRSSTGTGLATAFGIASDRPVQGDYDGDAKTDLAVYRDGTWYIARSSDGAVQIGAFGIASDRPVSGDFDGDGKYDLAIYRDGVWWVLRSLTGTANAVPWGAAGDIPVPADYDADGTTDFAVFRPSTGDWYVIRSSNNTSFGLHWGVNNDVPVPSRYLPQ